MALHHSERDEFFSIADNGEQLYLDHMKSQLGQDKTRMLVAEFGNHVVGFCFATIATRPPVFRDREYGTIWDLAVTASARGQGVGTALLNEMRQWFAQKEVDRIEVRVASTNESAQGFWRKAGFRPYMDSMYQQLSELEKK